MVKIQNQRIKSLWVILKDDNLERGATQFHKEVLKTVSGWTQFVLDNSSIGVVQKTQSKLHQNALSAGFQFVEYKAPNGVRVKLDVDPINRMSDSYRNIAQAN